MSNIHKLMDFPMPQAHNLTPCGKTNGAVLAISSIPDSMCVILGASGCGFVNQIACRTPLVPIENIICTNFSNEDIILGCEEKIIAAVLEIYMKYKPSVIALVPTSITDIVSPDVEGIINRLQSEVKCPVIWIKSDKISHADKRKINQRYINNIMNFVGDLSNHDPFLKGCGFVDSMKILVHHIMKPQPIKENLINLSGIEWGIHKNKETTEFISQLNEIGCKIHATLPNCTVDEIASAPAASLNILSNRVGWAVEMEKTFGTPFVSIDGYYYTNYGIAGLVMLYQKIADKLNLSPEKWNQFLENCKDSQNKLENSLTTIDRSNALLYCENYLDLYDMLNFFYKTLHYEIKTIIIRVNPEGYLSMYSKNELIDKIKESAQSYFAQNDIEIPVFLQFHDLEAFPINSFRVMLGEQGGAPVWNAIPYIGKPCGLSLNLKVLESQLLSFVQNCKNEAKVNDSSSMIYQKLIHHCTENHYDKEKCELMWDSLWIKYQSQKGEYQYETDYA